MTGKIRKFFFSRFFLILISFMVGVLWNLNTEYQVLRLDFVEVKPDDPVLEKIFWKVFPQKYTAFWPGLLLKEHVICRSIERLLPVEAKMEIRGPGDFVFSASPLDINGLVHWKDRKWFFSESGKVWSYCLDTGILYRKEDFTNSYEWFLDTNSAPLIDVADIDEKNRVVKATFPLDLLNKWKVSLERYDWKDRIDKAKVYSRDGEFKVELMIANGSSEIEIILNGKDAPWSSKISAIAVIIPEFPDISGNCRIDTTFSERIVIKEY